MLAAIGTIGWRITWCGSSCWFRLDPKDKALGSVASQDNSSLLRGKHEQAAFGLGRAVPWRAVDTRIARAPRGNIPRGERRTLKGRASGSKGKRRGPKRTHATSPASPGRLAYDSREYHSRRAILIDTTLSLLAVQGSEHSFENQPAEQSVRRTRSTVTRRRGRGRKGSLQQRCY